MTELNPGEYLLAQWQRSWPGCTWEHLRRGSVKIEWLARTIDRSTLLHHVVRALSMSWSQTVTGVDKEMYEAALPMITSTAESILRRARRGP